MKRQKTMICMALLVAILMLGIGYAVIGVDNLKVTGTAKTEASQTNFKVLFDNTDNAPVVTTKEPSTATVTPGVDSERKTATLAIEGLTKAGDQAVIVYTINNESENISTTLALDTSEFRTDLTEAEGTDKYADGRDYISVNAVLGTSDVIAAGDSTTLTVTVTMTKTPVKDIGIDIEIPFTATPVEQDAA